MTALKGVFAATALVLASPMALAQGTNSPAVSEDVVLIADTLLENDADNTVIAEGNVEVSYQGRILKADRVVYNRDNGKVRATGNVIILDPDGSERFAEEVEVNSNLSDGYAVGFSMRLANGGQAVANSAIRQEGGLNALDQVVYTSCEVCGPDDTPTWALRARRAVLDEEEQMMSYRDAVLEVGGVPVIYLPYFAHPDPASERRSGLLFPDIGVSTKLGAFYQQPYYWAMSDSQEMIISPQVNGKVNPFVEFNYTKRFWSGDLNIHTSVTQEALFNGDGEFIAGSDESVRSHIFASGLFAVTDDWSWGFGAERASDDFYLQRYDIDGIGDVRGLYVGEPRRLISQLFVVGQDEDYYSETALLSFQLTGTSANSDNLPTVAPVMYTERMFDFGSYGFATVEASSAVLLRDSGADSQRVSFGADWSRETVLPGGVLLDPFIEVRADYYGLDEAVSGEENVTRAVGSAGATLSYPLIRRGETVDIMVEPIVMGAWGVSGANKNVLPNEDSQLFESDTSTLFEPNAATGYDLYEGDGRLAAGIRTTARWQNGVEISAEGGRRWRSRSDPAFGTFSNLDGTASDWVANSSIDLGGPLRLEAGVRLDDDSLELNRVDARLSTNLGRVRGGIQYFKLEDGITASGGSQEGITIDGRVQLTDRFSVYYSRVREIEENFDLTHGIGISYQDECSIFSISYQRRDNRDAQLGPSESINFQFSLLTLGSFGSADVD